MTTPMTGQWCHSPREKQKQASDSFRGEALRASLGPCGRAGSQTPRTSTRSASGSKSCRFRVYRGTPCARAVAATSRSITRVRTLRPLPAVSPASSPYALATESSIGSGVKRDSTSVRRLSLRARLFSSLARWTPKWSSASVAAEMATARRGCHPLRENDPGTTQDGGIRNPISRLQRPFSGSDSADLFRRQALPARERQQGDELVLGKVLQAEGLGSAPRIAGHPGGRPRA